MKKVVITTDSASDIGTDIANEYKIFTVPLHVIIDGKDYLDGENVSPDDIFSPQNNSQHPKTSAVTVFEYEKFFRRFTDAGYAVVHLSLSSKVSSSYSNALIAKTNIGSENIFIVDSLNLSSGISLLAMKAGELRDEGMSASEIAESIEKMRDKVDSSFVLDTLEFMRKSGRCSSVKTLGANLLSIKPSIEVSENGTLVQSKKYRGDISRVREKYICDRLNNKKTDKTRVFVTHSGLDENELRNISNFVKEKYNFERIFVNRAGCTVSVHCGPGTMGILFMTE